MGVSHVSIQGTVSGAGTEWSWEAKGHPNNASLTVRQVKGKAAPKLEETVRKLAIEKCHKAGVKIAT